MFRTVQTFAVLALLCASALFLAGCSKKTASDGGTSTNAAASGKVGSVENFATAAVSFSALEKNGSMSLRYATQFCVDYYALRDVVASAGATGAAGADGTRSSGSEIRASAGATYALVRIADSDSFLLVPEGAPIPVDVPRDITPLQLPLKNVYLVATSAMDLINECGALEQIAFSGTKAKDWSVPEAAAAMNAGKITYAGKYSAPDYELLTAGGCELAIESTMIFHKPEVKEKLEELGIPVLVEYSSYEPHPLGRLEWIKLYGVLFGKAAAEQYYESEYARIEPIMRKEPVGKSVAFFYVNSNGAVNVRKPNDYIVKIIELAGGKYALSELLVEEENALSTMNMMMEDFYVSCVDADILVYNGTIDQAFSSIDDLFAKSELFRDFAAVKSGEVYFVSKDFYQQTTGIANFIEDLNKVLNGEYSNLIYLTKL